jgi:flagellar hook-length control protein FliK
MELDDGESGRGAKASVGATERNDAVSSTRNSPAAAVVTVNLPSATGGATAVPEKGKSAVKPIKGHGEVSAGPLGRAMLGATELARGHQPGGEEEAPQVDATRFVGRVARAFHTAQERGGVLQLRLSPPELGSLKLQLIVKDGVLSASLETDNAQARRILLDHLPALRDRLAEQNIRIERFDVDVQQDRRDPSNPRGSNQNPYHQQPEQSAPRRGSTTQSRTFASAPPEPSPAASPHISATEIDLVV